MAKCVLIPLAASLLLTALPLAEQSRDARVADLISAGKLRVALFLPQYDNDPQTGEIRGNPVYVDVARALAARVGVAIELIAHPTPAKAVECLNQGRCDIGFMASNEPSRAAEVDFSPPVVQLDYTYLVPGPSAITHVADADAPQIRIAAVQTHASTLVLQGVLKHAQQVPADVPETAFELLRSGRADAWAAVRTTLIPYVSKLPGSRVLADRYGENLIAIAVQKGRAERLAYVTEFVKEAKSSGLVQQAITRAGDRAAGTVIPEK